MDGGKRLTGTRVGDLGGSESIICIMYSGSGLGGVQNLNSEHLRGTINRKIQWMEAKCGPDVGGNRVGWREPRADGSLKLAISIAILHARHTEGGGGSQCAYAYAAALLL